MTRTTNRLRSRLAQLRQNALVLVGLLACALPVNAELIRDIADFEGVRDNQLIGYGLVVGLDGTGDQTQQAPFTGQSLINMLQQLGVSIPPGTNMQIKNAAAVMVTANLKPFMRQGQRMDISVSSVGNAKSLRGGTLIMTPLKGVDGKIYAMAQGNLMVGGISAEGGGSSVKVNQQSGGRIPNGAIVERELPTAFSNTGYTMDLQLKEASFTTARRMVWAINHAAGAEMAKAVDSRVVKLTVPQNNNELVAFLEMIENIDVDPAQGMPKVVINSRTGSVVLSGDVQLRQAAVAHGNITVTIDTVFNTSQPNPLAEGETKVTPETRIDITRDKGTLNLVEGADLAKVVGALNALGASTDELMSILEALKASGALRADIQVI